MDRPAPAGFFAWRAFKQGVETKLIGQARRAGLVRADELQLLPED
jgi:hypothetical protein